MLLSATWGQSRLAKGLLVPAMTELQPDDVGRMQVLQTDKASAKALFRRGRARARLGQADAARTDLEQAAQLSPDDGAIKRELAALSR